MKIEGFLRNKKVLLAFSGGKDAIATAIVLKENNINFDCICETSFYFPEQLDSIIQVAKAMDLNVEYKCSLENKFIYDHPEVVFSDSAKINGWGYSVRQQRTVKRKKKSGNYDIAVYGRRTEENCVPSKLYETKDGWQYHPLRDIKKAEVFEIIKKAGVKLPMIYSTEFGFHAGNAPFYSLRHAMKIKKSIPECWTICNVINDCFYKEYGHLI